jgi:putative ABC transport system permease protein
LRDRAFTVTAVVTLAIAIALNVTAFTVMDAMVFRGLPGVTRSNRLVYLAMRQPSDLPCCPGPISYADFETWRAEAQAFDDMSFGGGGGQVPFRVGTGRPIDMSVSRTSTNTFGLLGVRPMLGRDFQPFDELPNAAPVAIISHSFWESRLAKRADVIGLTVHISGAATTIIGVMPKDFVFVYERNIWVPLVRSPELEGSAIGRLRDGSTLESARAELETINARLVAADPARKRGVPSVRTYSQAHVAPDAPIIYRSLWVGAWFVLLIACANLANLTVARTMGRSREFSTRIALGAGLGRVMRQLVVENLLLAGVAGALGWWVTTWSVRTWATATASRYLALDYTVHSGTLAYLITISTLAATLVSVVPIANVVHLGVTDALKGAARGVTQDRRGKRLAAGLIAGQVLLAIVLLLGAGVLVRSFQKIVTAETGVRDPERILVGSMRLPSDKYPNPDARVAYFDQFNERVRTIPGVEGASVAGSIPTRVVNRRRFEIEERPSASAVGEFTQFMTVGTEYFRVLGAPVISGREFDDRDDAGSLSVVIVNESFTATFWPDEPPLGKRLRLMDRDTPGAWRTVVGIVPNIMQGDATRQSFKPVIYVPFRQQPFAGQFFFVRTNGAVTHVARGIRAELQKLDPDVIVAEDFTTLKARFAFDRDFMDLEHADLAKHAAVAPILAAIALTVAAIGLIAVMTHSVTQRTKEIGVRMAIGAAAQDIRKMVVREGMVPVALGTFLGLAASLAVNRVLQSQLVGVSPYDPPTMIAAPVVLIVVALVACLIPARHATHVDPMVALRYD